MHVVIVGAGAMGRFLGGMLGRGGHEVTFVERDPGLVDVLNERGIQFIELGTSGTEPYLTVKTRATTDGRSIQTCDLSILAVKNYSTASAVRSINQLVTAEAPILTIQTGLGNIETMAEIVDIGNVLGGVTYHGATSLHGSSVRHAGTGMTFIGEINFAGKERAEGIKAVFDASDIQTRVTDNVLGYVWAKAVVYSAVNPLTALLRLKNGQLTEKMESIALAKRLIDEGKQVAQAYGIEMSPEDLYDSLLEVCRRTSENLSPMLQDILNGRRTEIESLNGAIHVMGKKRGLSVSTHQTMTELIHLTEKWRKGSDWQ